MIETDPSPDRIAIHEAGHTVAGFLLGGTLGWVAIGKVDPASYPDQTDDTMGSTQCLFGQKLPDTPTMDDVHAQEDRIRKYIMQTYAGSIAEELEYGEVPNQGQIGDFARIWDYLNEWHNFRAVAHGETVTQELIHARNIELRNATVSLIAHSENRYAIRVLADALKQRIRLDGQEASDLISAAIERWQAGVSSADDM